LIETAFGYKVNLKTRQQRKILSGTFLYKGKKIRITTTHIDVAGNLEERLRQNNYLMQYVLSKPAVRYEIICGDFNTIRGFTFHKEVAALNLLYKDFSEICSEISWTEDFYHCSFRSKHVEKIVRNLHIHYRQKLDHIWSKGFNIQESKLLPIEGSDHFPLLADVSI